MTDTPNFRALCAKLADCLQWYIEEDDVLEGGKWDEENFFWIEGKHKAEKAVSEAFAAIATPPPEPPTDEQLVNFRNRATADCCSSRSNNGANLLSDDDLVACQVAGLRAVLERWG